MGGIRYRLPYFLTMKLIELFENKSSKKIVKSPPARNFVAKNAQHSGAGSHETKKYSRKEKHKNKNRNED
jgi:hypothetical protein